MRSILVISLARDFNKKNILTSNALLIFPDGIMIMTIILLNPRRGFQQIAVAKKRVFFAALQRC